ncbi:MAG: aldo/keto reductase [Cytophagaceae bacterium]
MTIPFGNTNIKITKIGLGLAALGRPGYINIGHGEDLRGNYELSGMQERAFEVLDAAYENGIRYFDVARSYGKGEEFLANWIKNRKLNVVVGSKWGYRYTADWQVQAEKHEVKSHTIDVLDEQWPLSERLLGDFLKIYHIHSATEESGVLENAKVIERLWQLKDNGIIVGLSLSGPKQAQTLLRAMEIRKEGKCLFQSVQITFNILEQSSDDVLKEASKEGFGIIVKEAVANGRLTGRNSDPEFAEKMRILSSIATKHRVGIDALSMAYVLHQGWCSIVLSGASTVEQLKSNLKANDVKLNESDLNALRSLAESPEEYWRKRGELNWN